MNHVFKIIGLVVTLLASAPSWSAGLEKNIMFGGRSAGIAGIATPYMQGAEALYFNPAGLIADRAGNNMTLDLSPTHSRFQGPIVGNNTTSKSDTKLLIPAALLYSRNLSESLGVGIGYYASGGAFAEFKDQGFAGKQGSAEAKTDVQITEIGLGAGYRVSDSLKLGLAYRVVMAKAAFSTIDQAGTGAVFNAKFTDLKATQFTGFKLGAQYKLSDKTALGFTYRSDVPVKAKGRVGGQLLGFGAPRAIADADVTVKTSFPDAYSLGVRHELNDKWNLLAEFVYTSYGRLKNIQVEGNLTVAAPFAAASRTDPAVQLGWKDQQSIKLAGEYLGAGLPIRFGYVWTSRVTDAQFARAAFVPPGPAHTLTAGTGLNLNESLSLDAGAEYTTASGDGHMNTGNTTKVGDYKVTEYALHLGASYSF